VTGRAAPRLIVIPDPRFAPGATVEGLAAAALAGGADVIQLRAKELDDGELVALGRRLARLCRAAGARLCVNDRPDLARACGADGVHVGPDDAAPAAARALLGPGALVGVSVYDEEDCAAAEGAGADYVAIGAVFPTRTKRVAVAGLEALGRWRRRTGLPIVAIGGVTAANAAAAVEAGADGVAVISAVSGAGDPQAATRELRRCIDEALGARGGGPRAGAHGEGEPWTCGRT
jgi:thiamine-phosphate pyrophosphorylase